MLLIFALVLVVTYINNEAQDLPTPQAPKELTAADAARIGIEEQAAVAAAVAAAGNAAEGANETTAVERRIRPSELSFNDEIAKKVVDTSFSKFHY